MQGEFIHDYDSQNYLRYVSREASREGVYRVVYIDKNFRHNLEDRRPINMILSESTSPATGRAPNPFLEARPIVLQPCPRPYGKSMMEEALERGYDIHREMAKSLRHATLYGSPIRWADGSIDHEHIKKLTQRIFKLEQRQGILFRAIEKILKRLLWVK